MNVTRSLPRGRARLVLGLIAISTAAAIAGMGVPTLAGAPAPSMVKDIDPDGSSNPRDLTPVGGILYFTAHGPKGRELYRSDGTPAGTYLVKDIRRGDKGSNPYQLTNVRGRLIFSAFDEDTGRELWTTDGTRQGTRRLTDSSTGPVPGSLTRVGDRLFFLLTRTDSVVELWASDGTRAGTERVKRLRAGGWQWAIIDGTAALGGKLYFQLVGCGGTLDVHCEGQGIWRSDGTAAGTRHFYGRQGSWHACCVRAGSRLFWHQEDVGLMRTDGTTAGTRFMGDVIASSMVDADGTLFFNGFVRDDVDDPSNDGLWRSDGTKATTRLVKALSNPYYLTSVDGRVYFRNYLHGEDEQTLWVSDGTEDGTIQLLSVGSDTRLDELTAFGDALYLVIGRKLWKSTGTPDTTTPVVRIGRAEDLTVVGDAIFFSGRDSGHGRELWRYVLP